jgi:chaperonin GroEL
MELVKHLQRPLLIFSEHLQKDPLSTIIYNMKRDPDFKVCAVNIPWMGEVENEIFDDLSILTGATVIDNDKIDLENLTIEMFGTAKKIIIGKDETQIIGGKGNVSEHLKTIHD